MPRARSRTPACSDEVLQGQSAKNVPGVIEHLEKHARTPRTAVKHGTVRSSTFLVDITRLSDRDTAHRPRFAEHTIGFVNVMLTSYYECMSNSTVSVRGNEICYVPVDLLFRRKFDQKINDIEIQTTSQWREFEAWL